MAYSSLIASRTEVMQLASSTWRNFRWSTFSFVLLLGFVSNIAAQGNPDATTAIDDYVNKPDSSYRWKVVSSKSEDGLTTVVIDMVSQTWRTKEEVDRPEWRHWVTVCIPDEIRSDIGFLYIGGGSNKDKAPTRMDGMMRQIAAATGTVVTELKMVPNQSLVFGNDGERRSEDDIIGYTWDKYLETGDATWPARNAMVKSAVRAMDTVTTLMASEDYGQKSIESFVVAGASKRGWTTWLTGAIDKRVVGIIPIVIDVLNADVSMRHHFASYGFWAPSVGNYVQHHIMERMDHPRMKSLYELVDPYYYRHRLTMPKLVLNSAGDQFFLPDSSQFYWHELSGPKYLRYVPNSDHSMRGTDALKSIIAFYSMVIAKTDGPKYSWETEGNTLVVTSDTKPTKALLWKAINPLARDFRQEAIGNVYESEPLEADEDGKFRTELAMPDEGWAAYFIELTFDVGAAAPLKLTSGIKVVPDIEPFAAKPPGLPTTVTIVCQGPAGVPATKITSAVQELVDAGTFPANELTVKNIDSMCYFNWQPKTSEFEKQAGGLAKFLKDNGCSNIQYQLESGPGATIAPQLQREAVPR